MNPDVITLKHKLPIALTISGPKPNQTSIRRSFRKSRKNLFCGHTLRTTTSPSLSQIFQLTTHSLHTTTLANTLSKIYVIGSMSAATWQRVHTLSHHRPPRIATPGRAPSTSSTANSVEQNSPWKTGSLRSRPSALRQVLQRCRCENKVSLIKSAYHRPRIVSRAYPHQLRRSISRISRDAWSPTPSATTNLATDTPLRR